jgi:type VI secretion system secreted protein Hcp
MRERSGARVRHVVAAIAILAGLAWSAPTGAATEECFLKIDGVTGDSADARHRGEIELVSWSLGMATPVAATLGTGASASSGRPDFQPLRVTHRLDRAVPALLQTAASGRHVPSAVLSCRRPGREAADYLKVALQDVLVSGVRLGDSADAAPSAEVTLVYGKITIEYRPQMPDGSLGQAAVGGWDVRANRPQ